MERHERKNVKEKKEERGKKKERRESWRRVLEGRINNIEKRYEIKEEEK